ncbi:hypothetical protein CRG98_011663 [Punica granatum]|uniref:Uncharacterized protein n=1 Tax=Punica granatum TaxID=22663 RepID=A0A2I0KHR3_PUNGR|nr:hypothetical protein CRG98_011663 [Punica granatum]
MYCSTMYKATSRDVTATFAKLHWRDLQGLCCDTSGILLRQLFPIAPKPHLPNLRSIPSSLVEFFESLEVKGSTFSFANAYQVYSIVDCPDFLNLYYSLTSNLSDKALTDIDMLGPLMVDLVLRQANGTLTVNVYHRLL